eukprot:TRINITY_DN8037_c0_g1_i2.p1 TRINITY_DN8037_c0_g1~~TRINITY_DN8037_c0_g1_i2.p1  ORF type:complete len:1849 (-),score=287.73 TRINITY_DN8037_c0_g1_i2:11-5557(-)
MAVCQLLQIHLLPFILLIGCFVSARSAPHSDLCAEGDVNDPTTPCTLRGSIQFNTKQVVIQGGGSLYVVNAHLHCEVIDCTIEFSFPQGVVLINETSSIEANSFISSSTQFLLDSTSTINTSGRSQISSASRHEEGVGDCLGCGGGHASYGGYCNSEQRGLPAHGSVRYPSDLGSGGKGFDSQTMNPGGGRVEITAFRDAIINGAILCNGRDTITHAGAGSGGSIYISTEWLMGDGDLQANGGSVSELYDPSVGSGSGGRVHVRASEKDEFYGDVQVNGGTSNILTNCSLGGPGTIFIERPSENILYFYGSREERLSETPYPNDRFDSVVIGNCNISSSSYPIVNISAVESISAYGSVTSAQLGLDIHLSSKIVDWLSDSIFEARSLSVNAKEVTISVESSFNFATPDAYLEMNAESSVSIYGRLVVWHTIRIFSQGLIRTFPGSELLADHLILEANGLNLGVVSLYGRIQTFLTLNTTIMINSTGSVLIRSPVLDFSVAAGFGDIRISAETLVTIDRSSLYARRIYLNSAKNITITNDSNLSASNLNPHEENVACDSLAYGGSYGGSGSSCQSKISKHSCFGDPTDPIELGIGGFPSCNRPPSFPHFAVGRGGGLVYIKSRFLALGGSIQADGGDSSIASLGAGAGSGGSIQIRYDRLVNTSSFYVSASGGSSFANDSVPYYGGGGSGGRIFLSEPPPKWTFIRVDGGLGSCGALAAGGTVYVNSTNTLWVLNSAKSEFLSSICQPNAMVTSIIVGDSANAAFLNRTYEHVTKITLNAGAIAKFPSDTLLSVKTLIISSLANLVADSNLRLSSLDYHDSSFQVYENGRLDVARELRVNVRTFKIEGSVLVSGKTYLSGLDLLFVGPFATLRTSSLTIQGVYADISGIVYITSRGCSSATSEGFYALLQSNFTIRSVGYLQSSSVNVQAGSMSLNGVISSTGLGCPSGVGFGAGESQAGLAGGGGGHGGRGGDGAEGAGRSSGGQTYGSAHNPRESGSGGGSRTQSGGDGGGVIRLSCVGHMYLNGAVLADGDGGKDDDNILNFVRHLTDDRQESDDDAGSIKASTREDNHGNRLNSTCLQSSDSKSKCSLARGGSITATSAGTGGGAGGSIALAFASVDGAGTVTATGGLGKNGGGGGGGGRIYINYLDKQPTAKIEFTGSYSVAAGDGSDGGESGMSGSMAASGCPLGRSGFTCPLCPVGTFNSKIGDVCQPCDNAPVNSIYTDMGWTTPECPYICKDGYISLDCEESIALAWRMLGGTTIFLLSCAGASCILLGAYVFLEHRRSRTWTSSLYSSMEDQPKSRSSIYTDVIDPFEDQLPKGAFLSDVRHLVCRIYFMGKNTPTQPWILPREIPISDFDTIIRMDTYEELCLELNQLMRWNKYEVQFYQFIKWVIPVAENWLRSRRKEKVRNIIQALRQKDSVGHFDSIMISSDLTSIKFGCCETLSVGYIDLVDYNYSTKDECVSLPVHVLIAGDGNYHSPYFLDESDPLVSSVTSLFPLDAANIWRDFIQDFNDKLHGVRFRHVRDTIRPLITFLIHENKNRLQLHGLHCNIEVIQVFTEYKLALHIDQVRNDSISDKFTRSSIEYIQPPTFAWHSHPRLLSGRRSQPRSDRFYTMTTSYRLIRNGADPELQKLDAYHSHSWNKFLLWMYLLFFPIYEHNNMTKGIALLGLLTAALDFCTNIFFFAYWFVIDITRTLVMHSCLPFMLWWAPLLSMLYILTDNPHWGRMATSAGFMCLFNWVLSAAFLIIEETNSTNQDLRIYSFGPMLVVRLTLVHVINLCLARRRPKPFSTLLDTHIRYNAESSSSRDVSSPSSSKTNGSTQEQQPPQALGAHAIPPPFKKIKA